MPYCPACLELLRHLCLTERNPEVCREYEAYLDTADDTALDRVMEIVPGQRMQAALERLRERGLVR